MAYQIIALFLSLAFYFIYIGKMLSQKQKGGQTDQIGKGGKVPLFYIEVTMKIATCGTVVAEITSIILNTSNLPQIIWITGGILAFLGVVVFAISVETMRDSWRAGIAPKDKTKIVTTEIYAWSRNPAFFGFDLLYIGILLMFFNWVLLLFSIFSIIMLHLQILQEEKFLPSVFGEEYRLYKERTGRYFGRRCAAYLTASPPL